MSDNLPQAADAQPPSRSTPIDFTQEIRFAVVMYGGASLCIYMNGVAQELLRLVRATAPGIKDATQTYLPDGSPKLGGSGMVYRKLGRMLARADNSLKERADGALRTRFVIDVLSGSSAGGINAVFLAKALANDQDMEELKRLWVEKADVDVLMNDRESNAEMPAQKKPRSLLNSRQMYYMLLDAMQDMDRRQRASLDGVPECSPYVEQLDLYVTTTDLVGRKISMRLADDVARERLHRNVFRFRYTNAPSKADREKDEPEDGGVENVKNDFGAKYNPFLAFAARCTSAHPVPFEPVKLADIDEALQKMNLGVAADDEAWQVFYEDYLQREDDPDAVASQPANEEQRKRLVADFLQRPFNDGGTLDNSPFSFVIDSLNLHQSKLPVDRKLLYVEPVPEHPEEVFDSLEKPDAFQTGWLSLSVLPSYQFIREDLERLLERNRLVERLGRILNGVEEDEAKRLKQVPVKLEEAAKLKQAAEKLEEAESLKELAEKLEKECEAEKPLNSYDFGKKTISEMIHRMGSAWGGYQRLRVAETTDHLVMMLARAAGLNEESDELLALRYLVRTWRFQNYDAEGTKGRTPTEPAPIGAKPDKESENRFLYKYDLKWRLRRLKFVMQKADEISCFDERTQKLLEIVRHIEKPDELKKRYDPDEELKNGTEPVKYDLKNLQEDKYFAKELRRIKGELGNAFHRLLTGQDSLLARTVKSARSDSSKESSENPLAAAVAKLNIKSKDLLEILKEVTDKRREAKSEEILQRNKEGFKEFQEVLDQNLNKLMERVSDQVKLGDGPLAVPPEVAPEKLKAGQLMARIILRHFYENFDRYDMISYPILYATNIGEEVDVVEVFRVSPEDAKHLIENRKDRRRKLAGAALGHFAAFFDKEFRRNDILWGRLDAAERIITALLSSVPIDESSIKDLEDKDLPEDLKAEEREEIKKKRREAERERLKKERRETEEQLIKEAQRAILAEEFGAENKASLRGLLGEALKQASAEVPGQPFFERLREQLESRSPELKNMQTFLDVCLADVDPLGYFRDTYKFEHNLEPKMMVRTSARASRVFGKMLEEVSDRNRVGQKQVVWVTRLAQLFWGMVEVAVPDSLGNLFWHHWLKVLYTFEALLIIFATLLVNEGAQRLGWTFLGITVTVNVLVLLLADWMRRRHSVLKVVLWLLGLLVFSVTAIGALKLVGLYWKRAPLSWLRGLFDSSVEWLKTHHVPDYLAEHSYALVILAVLAVIILLLNAVGLFDPQREPWGRLLKWLGWDAEKFKPFSIKEAKEPSKTGEATDREGPYVFRLRLSGKPTMSWTELFQADWAKRRPQEARASIEEDEIYLACQREMVDGNDRKQFLRETIEKLKDAVATANEKYEKELEDKKKQQGDADATKEAKPAQPKADSFDDSLKLIKDFLKETNGAREPDVKGGAKLDV